MVARAAGPVRLLARCLVWLEGDLKFVMGSSADSEVLACWGRSGEIVSLPGIMAMFGDDKDTVEYTLGNYGISGRTTRSGKSSTQTAAVPNMKGLLHHCALCFWTMRNEMMTYYIPRVGAQVPLDAHVNLI